MVPALKNWFFFYPVAIVLLFLVTLTFIFAYAVHAAELHAPDEDGEVGDAVWRPDLDCGLRRGGAAYGGGQGVRRGAPSSACSERS